jgi:hypothetical protein
MRLSRIVLLAQLSISSCGGQSPTHEEGDSSDATSNRRIGEGCTHWVGTGPASLPTGQRYCLSAGDGEHGYTTANCGSDTDCPDDARCDFTFCRVSCNSDEDCGAPTSCGSPVGGEGRRVCRTGVACPATMPSAGYSCYQSGPFNVPCAYGATVCTCELSAAQSAIWNCYAH